MNDLDPSSLHQLVRKVLTVHKYHIPSMYRHVYDICHDNHHNGLVANWREGIDFDRTTTKKGMGGIRKKQSISTISTTQAVLTELDHMNGYIVRKGIEYGIPTPVNQYLVEEVQQFLKEL